MPAAIVNITRIQRDGVRLLGSGAVFARQPWETAARAREPWRRVVAAVYTTYTDRTQRGRAEGETIIIIVV